MASLLLIFLHLAMLCSLPSISADGYRKKLRTKEEKQEAIIQLIHSNQAPRVYPSRVIQLSWQPRVFLYRGFLSDNECDHLISLAQAHRKIEGSVVKGGDSGKVVDNSSLASSAIPLDKDKDKFVASIEDRILAWTFLPQENSKTIQVLHYGIQETRQNYDYFGYKVASNQPLIATVLLYLSNVNQGGQILFPKSKDNLWSESSDCTKGSYDLRPIKGNAILFFSLHPNITPDESSFPAICPVLEGEKWYATKFFQIQAHDSGKVSLESDSDECTDEDDNCSQWAAIGECQRNPLYMIGSPDYYGSCRKSCNAC